MICGDNDFSTASWYTSVCNVRKQSYLSLLATLLFFSITVRSLNHIHIRARHPLLCPELEGHFFTQRGCPGWEGFFPFLLSSSLWGCSEVTMFLASSKTHEADPRTNHALPFFPSSIWSLVILYMDGGIRWGRCACALVVGIWVTYSHSPCVVLILFFSLNSNGPIPLYAGLLPGPPDLCGSDRTQIIMGSSRCVLIWFHMVKHSAFTRQGPGAF